MRIVLTFLSTLVLAWPSAAAEKAPFRVEIKQITHGPMTHFFGYIGHVQNIPWNQSGRYIVALQTDFHDRMPGPDDPANVVLIDTKNDYRVKVIEQSRGWNPQQGTMFYWNPAKPETQFFFNDRDRKTGKVFCVLYDIEQAKRIREYRFDDTPIGNGGVAQNGGWFLGLNYARMARLRPVTGYKGTWDWTKGIARPKDDGLFKVDIGSGEKTLLVSFHRMARELEALGRDMKTSHLFINHSLSNREGDRIFFFARAGWSGQKGKRINHPFVTDLDGKSLRSNRIHIGGHPEWDYGHRMIGRFTTRISNSWSARLVPRRFSLTPRAISRYPPTASCSSTVTRTGKRRPTFTPFTGGRTGLISGRAASISATGSPAICGRIPPRAGTAPTIKSSCPASAGMAKRGSCFCSQ